MQLTAFTLQQHTVHHGLFLVPTHLFGGVLLRCKTPTQLQFCQMAQQVPHHSSRPSPLSLCLFSHVLPLTGSAPVLSTTPLTPCYLLHHPTRWIPLILDTRNSINATFFFSIKEKEVDYSLKWRCNRCWVPAS